MKASVFSVLGLLADGEFHSGEELARILGVSRGTVWNMLQQLLQQGIEIHRVPGRGYRLADPVQPLSLDRIAAALEGASVPFVVEVHPELESTNSYLLKRAVEGAAHGTCVVAEMQTAGRGRRGRSWHAPLGGALTFSVLWLFQKGASDLSGLSLATGVALIRALRAEGVADAALKWPNDVLHGYRKLAGILIELQGDMLGPTAAVIGVGINLHLPDDIRQRIDQAVTDLRAILAPLPDRNRFLAGLLTHLGAVLSQFELEGFAGLRGEWLSAHAYQSKPVCLMMPDASMREGVVLDVAVDGALLVDTGQGVERFNAGEISLRSRHDSFDRRR